MKLFLLMDCSANDSRDVLIGDPIGVHSTIGAAVHQAEMLPFPTEDDHYIVEMELGVEYVVVDPSWLTLDEARFQDDQQVAK